MLGYQIMLIFSISLNSFTFQKPAVSESGKCYRGSMVRRVRRQWASVRPWQPEELLDGRRRYTHPVRFGSDGHIRGRAREHEDAAGDTPPAPVAAGRLRRRGRWRPERYGRPRVLRRVRRGIHAQAVAATVLRRSGHAAEATVGARVSSQ